MASEDAEKKQHLTGNIVALTGLIGAIATITPVFESLTRLADASQQTIEAWRNLGIWIGLPLGIVVFGFGLYIRFTRYSQLMMIDALRIDPDNPQRISLVGPTRSANWKNSVETVFWSIWWANPARERVPLSDPDWFPC